MGNEHRVVVGGESAVTADEVEQVRHLLQIGGDGRVVSTEMDVVELKVDDVLDRIVAGGEPAGGMRRGGGRTDENSAGHQPPDSSPHQLASTHGRPPRLQRKVCALPREVSPAGLEIPEFARRRPAGHV
jgi:hypothetical protein